MQKEKLMRLSPFITGAFISLFGEWNYGLYVLVVFMIFDYILGFFGALFGVSAKSDNGALQSKAMFVGIFKKILTLSVVSIAHLVGELMAIQILRDTVVIGLVTYECISILEHLAMFGVKLPQALVDVLEIMKNKEKEGLSEQG